MSVKRSESRLLLALYVPKFSKNGAASFTDRLEIRLGLSWLHLGLPELHLSCKSGTATEAVPQTHVIFEDAYCSLPVEVSLAEF